MQSKGAIALSLNCDKVVFGGVLEDMTESREAASKAVLGASNGENQDFLHSRWTKLLLAYCGKATNVPPLSV